MSLSCALLRCSAHPAPGLPPAILLPVFWCPHFRFLFFFWVPGIQLRAFCLPDRHLCRCAISWLHFSLKGSSYLTVPSNSLQHSRKDFRAMKELGWPRFLFSAAPIVLPPPSLLCGNWAPCLSSIPVEPRAVLKHPSGSSVLPGCIQAVC